MPSRRSRSAAEAWADSVSLIRAAGKMSSPSESRHTLAALAANRVNTSLAARTSEVDRASAMNRCTPGSPITTRSRPVKAPKTSLANPVLPKSRVTVARTGPPGAKTSQNPPSPPIPASSAGVCRMPGAGGKPARRHQVSPRLVQLGCAPTFLSFLCPRCRAGLCNLMGGNKGGDKKGFLCPRCRAGLCDQKHFVFLPQWIGFYALDVGRGFATG